jgi:nitrate/nitrite transporter NarK
VLALYALLVPAALVLSTAVTANALISRWFVRRRGLALGLSAFGIGLAGVLLPPLIATILPTAGWRTIWRDGGVLIAALVVPLVLLVVRNRPSESEGSYYLSGDGGRSSLHGHTASAGQLGWREVVARKNFWLLVTIYLPMMALSGGVGQNLAPFAASHGLSQQSGGALLSVLSGSHIVATLALGILSDRFGNRLPFVVLALVMVAGALILAFGHGLPILASGCALVGLGGGLFTLLAAAIAVEFGAEGVGRAFGMCMLFIPVTALAPFAIARTQESTGSYVPALMCLAALVLISGAVATFLRERCRQPDQAGVQRSSAAHGS